MDDIKQGSDEWRKLRAGKVTASRIKDIIAKTKSGYSTSRTNYRDELVKERFGVISEGFTNAAMEHGTETEPIARSLYEIKTGNAVQEISFVPHPYISMSGMSPDGYVGDDGMIEIKCPNTTTHFDYLLEGEVPEKYKPQMAWQLACSGRDWVDFISYDPRAPGGLDYFCVRYFKDEEYIKYLEDEVIQFLDEVNERYEVLRSKLMERVNGQFK